MAFESIPENGDFSSPPRSAYVHFPFCVKKCPYCDFISFPLASCGREGYADALAGEIALTAKKMGPERESAPLSTIYMGGGTPSVFSPEEIESVLKSLFSSFPVSGDAEITLEANPGTVDTESLTGYRKAGINRISLGIQSFSDLVLRRIGRIHSATQAGEAIDSVKSAGFSNFSCDLMTGLPGQTVEDALDGVRYLVRRQVPHISLYALTLESGTAFCQKYRGREEVFLPSQEIEREMYHGMIDVMRQSGYVHYEISNCSLPGYESRHNLNYWEALPYYGFGCGARSYYRGKRRANTENLPIYLNAMSGKNPQLSLVQQIEERISAREEKKEYMLLGFRRITGISGEDYRIRFGSEVRSDFGAQISSLLRKKYIEERENCFCICADKMDFANAVFREFV